jgi:hypothetical protein
MSSYSFHLRFTGLCAFVPHRGERENMRVVLVNAHDHAAGMHHEPHVAAVVVRRHHLEPAGQRPYFDFQGSRYSFGDYPWRAWLLEDEELTIDPDEPELKIAPGPQAGSDCPRSDADGFGWIARLSTVGEGTISSRAFGGTDSDLVRARLKIQGGALSTWAPAHNASRTAILKWQFRQPQGGGNPIGTPRALAEVMELTQNVTEDKGITLKSNRGNDIVLKPAPKGGEVVAWLVNMPEADIRYDRTEDPRRPDHHFAHFYRLSERGVATHVPHPVGDCGFAGANISNPRCPPALFQSV